MYVDCLKSNNVSLWPVGFYKVFALMLFIALAILAKMSNKLGARLSIRKADTF